jgi:DNA invertase Pin-like site-specific DNA recombinase
MTAAVIYCRVSMQDDEALRDQEVECRELVEDRGWEIAGVYAETGNPGLRCGQALDAITAGKASVIVTWDITRLFRRPADLLGLLNMAGTTEHHLHTIVPVYGEDWQFEWPMD